MKGPLFYSKILLFGEYGIIKDSKGLSIPYNFYNGALKYGQNQNDVSAESNNILKEYYQYLKKYISCFCFVFQGVRIQVLGFRNNPTKNVLKYGFLKVSH